MRTAWGVLKAVKMRGVEDRGDFYQFWYMAEDLGVGEQALEGWQVTRMPQTRSQRFAPVGGNLVLTTKRVLFEPMRSQRAAYGRHGSKLVVNGLASVADRLSGPVSSWSAPVAGLLAEAHDGEKLSVRLFREGELINEFYCRRPTAFRGDRATRDSIVARLSRA